MMHRSAKSSTCSSVSEHYSNLLAPIYLWMVGGLESALELGTADIAPLCDSNAKGRIAVDLGAGFGMHAIPLARQGYTVIAIDTSTELISQLRSHSPDVSIRTVTADILDFPKHVHEPADLILCMGDTLTHLQEQASINDLFQKVARFLKPGGKFALTFRDYTMPPGGIARFIPVKSDQDRILTCFLEATPTHMQVHDVLYERNGATWQMRLSSYMKLRLSPEWVAHSLENNGLVVQVGTARGGLVSIVATS
jgi:SAM-dependent methyltransferase